MRQVKHTVEVWVDRLTAPREVDENGLLTAVALVSLEAGDPLANRLRPAGRTALKDLSIEGSEFAVVEANGNLRGHPPSITQA